MAVGSTLQYILPMGVLNASTLVATDETALSSMGIAQDSIIGWISRRRQVVLTASIDGTAKIWDAATGDCKATLQGYGGQLTTAVYSPDGSCVLTASEDGTAKIWDAVTGECKV